MADGSVSISLGDTLPYLEERFLQLIGKDQASKETTQWFNNLQQTALIHASHVQCIGMHRPLPLNEIYQTTRLHIRGAVADGSKSISVLPQDRTSRSIIQGHSLAKSMQKKEGKSQSEPLLT